MADTNDDDAPGVTILVRQHGGKIDLSVKGLIPVEELAASLKRAGITHLLCEEVKGHRTADGGFYEEIELTSATVEGE